MQKVFWTAQNHPATLTLDQVMLQIRNDDVMSGLLYEPVVMSDVMDGVEQIMLDALIVQNARLQAKMAAMGRVMNRVSSELKVVDSSPQISAPFLKNGTAMVASVFELSDGQTVSIFFHNPDVNPKQITGADQLFSFKWLLNKKDVTIVVAPENGKDLDVTQVATRIMKLAQKNMAAFARSNQKRADKIKMVAQLEETVAEKEQILLGKLQEIERLQQMKSDREIEQALSQEKSAELAAKYGEIATELEEHYGTSQAFWEESIAEIQAIPEDIQNRLENGLEEANFHYERYIFKAKRLGLAMVADILESQQRTGQRLTAFVSHIFDGEADFNEALQRSYTQQDIASLGKPAQKFVADLRAAFGYAEPVQPQVVEITGNELGAFDTTTAEGKAALRNAAFEHLISLAQNNETVFCQAVNANVAFSKSGAKKFKSFSANPIKNQIAAAIKTVIRNATLVKGDIVSHDTDEQDRGITYSVLKTEVTVNGETYGVRTILRKLETGQYHYDMQLKENIDMIMDSTNENELRAARLQIRCSSTRSQSRSNLDGDNATPVYDSAQAEKIKLVFAYANSLGGSVVFDDTALAKADLENTLDILQTNLPIHVSEGNFEQAKLESEHIKSIQEALMLFDSVNGNGYVLNLFVFDKDGNLLEDEPLEETDSTPGDIDTLEKQTNEATNMLNMEDNDKAQEDTDIQFLRDVINGRIDVVADGFEDEFEPVVVRLGEEHELVNQALEVYAQAIDKLTAGM